ncbi:MAG: hypothetical protein JXN61_13480 [Sedimentisphaerales bacterium]|nr:hypothetical protein [Sedimentisphaerales bacterium]
MYANGFGIMTKSYHKTNKSILTNNTTIYNFRYGVYNVGQSELTLSNCILWGNGADDLYSVVDTSDYENWPLNVKYCCIGDGFDANDPNYTGCIDSDPCLANVCLFVDKTSANGTATTIIVADVNLYEVNDVIEYNNDGSIRTVTDVNVTSSTITFDNALDANSAIGVLIYSWGPEETDVNEDCHLASSSPCIDAGDPNGDYEAQVDFDGQPRLMVTDVDIGADEAAYIPSCHPDYDEWLDVGEPVSWCYPRQCHGDADGLKLLDPNCPVGPFWVQQNDLDILLAGWHQPYSGDPDEDPWIAADFDHEDEGGPKTGYFRVLYNDLNILTASWKQPDANVPGDCSNCP